MGNTWLIEKWNILLITIRKVNQEFREKKSHRESNNFICSINVTARALRRFAKECLLWVCTIGGNSMSSISIHWCSHLPFSLFVTYDVYRIGYRAAMEAEIQSWRDISHDFPLKKTYISVRVRRFPLTVGIRSFLRYLRFRDSKG